MSRLAFEPSVSNKGGRSEPSSKTHFFIKKLRNSTNAGFSLLEMLVAVAVLGLTLGALYQAVGGATRNVRIDEKYSYAIVLAESLLANYAVVPSVGLKENGETEGGFQWSVVASGIPIAELPESLKDGALQNIGVRVFWVDGSNTREFTLNSVVIGFGESN